MMLRSFVLSVFLTFSLGQLVYAEMLDEGPIVTSEQSSQSAAEVVVQDQQSSNEETSPVSDRAISEAEAQAQEPQQPEEMPAVSDQPSEPMISVSNDEETLKTNEEASVSDQSSQTTTEVEPQDHLVFTEEPRIAPEEPAQTTTELPDEQSAVMTPPPDVLGDEPTLRSDQPSQPTSRTFRYYDQVKRALLYGAVYGPWVAGIFSILDKDAPKVYHATNVSSVLFYLYLMLESRDIRQNYRNGDLLASINPKNSTGKRKVLNFAKNVSLYMGLVASPMDTIRRIARRIEKSDLFPYRAGELITDLNGPLTRKVDPLIAPVGLVGLSSSFIHLCLLGGEKLYDWYQARSQAAALKASLENQPSPAS